jgi:hypothetical protein
MRNAFLLIVGWALAGAALPQDRQLTLQPAKSVPSGERRIALIIGNSAYKNAPLRNPVNDARAISKALSATGFKVTVLEDASQSSMRRAIRSFGDDIQTGGVGLFYYAGHGMQVRGKNYLIPVNSDIEREDEIEDQAVDASLVLSKMDTAKNTVNLMILDACRNNPFQRTFRSAAQGLAQMEAPSGTLIAFATAPGSVAADGEGVNGMYTKHLLASMGKPGLSIEHLFKEVRRGVAGETKDRQIPWESSSLRGDFYFIAPDAANLGDAQRRQMDYMIQQALARQREEFERERRGGQPAAAPAPQVAAAARPQRDEGFWDTIKTSNNPDDYKAYLERFPQGAYAALARARANAPGAATPVQVASVAPSPLAGGGLDDPRYPKVGDHWQYRYTDRLTRVKKDLRHEIKAISRDGILETISLGTQSADRAHAAARQLSLEDNIWQLSPYLLSFAAPKPGERWGEIEPLRTYHVCRQTVSCRFVARVVGRETVTVPAGRFEATKVLVEFIGYSTMGVAATATTEIAFWYSEQVKRVVKTSTNTIGDLRFITVSDFDLELVSYKLN